METNAYGRVSGNKRVTFYAKIETTIFTNSKNDFLKYSQSSPPYPPPSLYLLLGVLLLLCGSTLTLMHPIPILPQSLDLHISKFLLLLQLWRKVKKKMDHLQINLKNYIEEREWSMLQNAVLRLGIGVKGEDC